MPWNSINSIIASYLKFKKLNFLAQNFSATIWQIFSTCSIAPVPTSPQISRFSMGQIISFVSEWAFLLSIGTSDCQNLSYFKYFITEHTDTQQIYISPTVRLALLCTRTFFFKANIILLIDSLFFAWLFSQNEPTWCRNSDFSWLISQNKALNSVTILILLIKAI